MARGGVRAVDDGLILGDIYHSVFGQVSHAPESPAGRFVVIETVDWQIHTDPAARDVVASRISGSLGWIEEQLDGTRINTSPEPEYIVAPWTRSEVRAMLADDWQSVYRKTYKLLEETGIAQDASFIGVMAAGFGGTAYAMIDGALGPESSFPPLFLIGDCALTAWLADDAPELGVDRECGSLPEFATTADAQSGAWTHEMVHTVGRWPYHDAGVMRRWWSWPNDPLSDEHVAALSDGPYALRQENVSLSVQAPGQVTPDVGASPYGLPLVCHISPPERAAGDAFAQTLQP